MADVVGQMDNFGLKELFEFHKYLTLWKLPLPVTYQDYTLVISLLTKGGGVTTIKNLRARMNLREKAVYEDRVCVEHNGAGHVIAAGFSKRYDPVERNRFEILIQNC